METGHQIAVRQIRAGDRCYMLEALDVWVRVTDLRVYIAREVRRGTCRYRVVLDHENRHVAIYRAGVKRLRAELEQALAAAPVTGAIEAQSPQQALERYAAAIGTLIADIREKNSQAMRRDNAVLDTPAAYRAEQRKCP
jgi:hypothetical protein